MCHPDYSLDHQTRDDPATCLPKGVLPALATPAAGTVLQVINSSPAIQETTCACSQQPGLHHAPVWKSLSSFLHLLSWRTTYHFHFSFSEGLTGPSYQGDPVRWRWVGASAFLLCTVPSTAPCLMLSPCSLQSQVPISFNSQLCPGAKSRRGRM